MGFARARLRAFCCTKCTIPTARCSDCFFFFIVFGCKSCAWVVHVFTNTQYVFWWIPPLYSPLACTFWRLLLLVPRSNTHVHTWCTHSNWKWLAVNIHNLTFVRAFTSCSRESGVVTEYQSVSSSAPCFARESSLSLSYSRRVHPFLARETFRAHFKRRRSQMKQEKEVNCIGCCFLSSNGVSVFVCFRVRPWTHAQTCTYTTQ